MSNKTVLLGIGLALVCVGVFKPNLNLGSKPSSVVSVVVDKPSDPELLKLAQDLVAVVQENEVTKEDGLKLSSLCYDMATLISLDGSSEVVKNTEEIRQANKLSGAMLRMDMNKKYPQLAAKMNAVVVGYIGDDVVVLNPELRTKAYDAFKAMSWAFNEGTK
jgi:hypothetical protein